MKTTFLKSAFLLTVTVLLSSCGNKWTSSSDGSVTTVTNEGGKTIAYSDSSGVKIITESRFAFKDLNRNGTLEPYEDWRLSAGDRAKDLASRLSVEQIAGLTLYSRHQSIPAGSRGFQSGTYGGKPFAESGAKPSDLSDDQMRFLTEDNVRHVLITSVQSAEAAAQWNNNAQALVEGMGFGIPINTSSDPRHRTRADAEYNAGSGGSISMWPGSLGMAATFDPDIVRHFGAIASREYRALGISTALSPQVDLATEPRWNRVSGTFGEDPQLSADMARAYIDGFQTSSAEKEIAGGWGFESVNCMVKHFPGGGSGEGGRDAHYGFGKYAVYPGNNFQELMTPFVAGAFKLEGGTSQASAVMPYYTISYGQNPRGENVGNSYSSYVINDLLRTKYGFDGVVCTDWSVTADETDFASFLSGKSWGVEDLSLAQRHYRILMAGVDQFGGNNDSGPVIEAYQIGVKEHGEDFMRARFEQSAVRLLTNIFRLGLFENPYLDPDVSQETVGNPEFMEAGYDAQLKSVVMIKNKNKALPVAHGKKVYIPKQYKPASTNFLGMQTPERLDYPVNMDIIKTYYEVTDNPAEADFAIAFIDSPDSGNGYSKDDAAKGGNGYLPISLQYNDYKATTARDPSIAGGDPTEDFTNRSYKGKTVKTSNKRDLAMVNDTFKAMKGKPVIVCLNLSNPTIVSEFEPNASAIIISFGVQDQALLDIIAGEVEPSALLPLQMPANMETVEAQHEDVPHDMTCYEDSEGNIYDFGFGLNWSGVIHDERTAHYGKKSVE